MDNGYLFAQGWELQLKRMKRILRNMWAESPVRYLRKIVRNYLQGDGFTFFERFGIHVLPVSYDNPIPDTRELRQRFSKWYRAGSFIGVDFHTDKQLKLLHDLRAYGSEFDGLPSYGEVAKSAFGVGYDGSDSRILYSMARHLKPHTIVEVGSGASTFFSANALSVNKRMHGIDSRIICIEPYPYPALESICTDSEIEIEIVPKLVQDVDVEFFSVLDGGDILFIDSSHTVKIGGAVNFLYHDVLPSLKKGVVIHTHDIPFPYPARDPEYWIFKRHHFWTEPALVQAFLAYNCAFKILLCSSYLHYKASEALWSELEIGDASRDFPSSLWLEKIL